MAKQGSKMSQFTAGQIQEILDGFEEAREMELEVKPGDKALYATDGYIHRFELSIPVEYESHDGTYHTELTDFYMWGAGDTWRMYPWEKMPDDVKERAIEITLE